VTITVGSVLMFLAIVCLLLAALNVNPFPRVSLFPLGMSLWAISLFMSVNVH
jgi:hypothetical protein